MDLSTPLCFASPISGVGSLVRPCRYCVSFLALNEYTAGQYESQFAQVISTKVLVLRCMIVHKNCHSPPTYSGSSLNGSCAQGAGAPQLASLPSPKLALQIVQKPVVTLGSQDCLPGGWAELVFRGADQELV